MSYQALARKWRPSDFDAVLGQEHVVSALRNGLDNERVHHAFLFTGTRGVGKTTLARIFAKALNCEEGVSSTPCGKCTACKGVEQGNFIDLIEVDAASRTKVDDTRELLDNVQYTPTQGRFKIYLIDEVHMLSTHSFNALLKTLEEPPEHVKFLLATTDPQKLPTTILSRCIQFNLKAMEMGQLSALLEKILKAEKIEFDAGALQILARSANGSARDALSLLDQGIAFGNGEVRAAQIRTMLGMIDEEFTMRLLGQIGRGEAEAALQTVGEMATRAVDFAAALDAILTAVHNVALYQVSAEAVEWKAIEAEGLEGLAKELDAELLQLIYQIAVLGKRDFSQAPDPRSGFEMVLLRMLAFRPLRAREMGVGERVGKANVGAGGEKKYDAGDGGRGEVGEVEEGRGDAGGAVEGGVAGRGDVHSGDSGNGVADSGDGDTDGAAVAGGVIWQKLARGEGWAECVAQSGLRGMMKEMAMHLALQAVEGETLKLTLDQQHAYLLDSARVKRMEEVLAGKFARALKLKVTLEGEGAGAGEGAGEGKKGAVGGEVANSVVKMPSQQQNHAPQEQPSAAELAFNADPNVQALKQMFDAEVEGDSIRAPKAAEGAGAAASTPN